MQHHGEQPEQTSLVWTQQGDLITPPLRGSEWFDWECEEDIRLSLEESVECWEMHSSVFSGHHSLLDLGFLQEEEDMYVWWSPTPLSSSCSQRNAPSIHHHHSPAVPVVTPSNSCPWPHGFCSCAPHPVLVLSAPAPLPVLVSLVPVPSAHPGLDQLRPGSAEAPWSVWDLFLMVFGSVP